MNKYIVESDFKYKDYRCVVIFSHYGYRCGYVEIPKNNILYGKSMSDKLPVKFSAITIKEIGKRSIFSLLFMLDDEDDFIRIDTYFDVHGGITYSNCSKDYPVDGENWWIGFDCFHYRDGRDLDLVEKLWGDDEKIKEFLVIERQYDIYYEYEVRSKEYVEQECRNLVDQIIDLEDIINEKTN